LSIAFGLAVLFVILGGFRYMTSGGNPEAVKKAQSMIQWALAGIALVALATTIVVIVTRLVAG
jgi:type IV secretory pathway TrbL component